MGAVMARTNRKLYKLEGDPLPSGILEWEKKKAERAMVTRAEQEEAFLLYLEDTRNAAYSARKAEIPLSTLTGRRQRSAKFAQRWTDALLYGAGRLMVTARQRAMDGHAGLLKFFIEKETPEESLQWQLRLLEEDLKKRQEQERKDEAESGKLPREVLQDRLAMHLLEDFNIRCEELTRGYKGGIAEKYAAILAAEDAERDRFKIKARQNGHAE